KAGRRADGELQHSVGPHRPVGALRHIDRPGLAFEGRHALAKQAEFLAAGRSLALAGDEDQADLAVARLAGRRLARPQAVEVETDISPAGALRRDVSDVAVALIGLDEQFRHFWLPNH